MSDRFARITPVSIDRRSPGRRRLLKGAAWAAPAIAVSTAAPAFAASKPDPKFGVLFDGGGGANGYLNSVYLNFGVANGQTAPMTLQRPIVITIEVIGLNDKATDERDYTVGSSYGTLTRGAYNATTRTTTLTWTLAATKSIPAIGTGTNVPDILFSFRDGGSSNGRITNKIVVRSISGGTITQPSSVPVDSSVVKDYNQKAVSPDGIY